MSENHKKILDFVRCYFFDWIISHSDGDPLISIWFWWRINTLLQKRDLEMVHVTAMNGCNIKKPNFWNVANAFLECTGNNKMICHSFPDNIETISPYLALLHPHAAYIGIQKGWCSVYFVNFSCGWVWRRRVRFRICVIVFVTRVFIPCRHFRVHIYTW